MTSKNPQVKRLLENDIFGDPYKSKREDVIWCLDDMSKRGPLLFSFDLEEVFNYWGDYPDHLTHEQKAIFDRENPGLAF